MSTKYTMIKNAQKLISKITILWYKTKRLTLGNTMCASSLNYIRTVQMQVSGLKCGNWGYRHKDCRSDKQNEVHIDRWGIKCIVKGVRYLYSGNSRTYDTLRIQYCYEL